MQTTELHRLVNQCVRCGQCRSACPIFKEEYRENTVARGRLALLRNYLEGKKVAEEDLNRIIAKCLLCKSCSAQCPSGVKADELVLAARELLAESQGLSFLKRAIFSVLKNRAVFDFGLTMASLFQDLGIKRVGGRRLGAITRFPMPGLARRRVLAPFASPSLRRQYPEVIRVSSPKGRVALYTGCTMNYIYTDAGRATIDVLAANGLEVVLPKMQNCCGFPVLAYGDVETAKLMARHNIEVFADLEVDAVITACGSCGSAWRHEYQRLLADEPEVLSKLQAIAGKTYDIAEYLTAVQPLDKTGLGEVNLSVTIHDPCHLGGRGMGVTEQVRTLVASVPGVKIIEMKEPGRCCGSGGSFNLTYYELSRAINDVKIRDIAGTGADAVLMGCGACRMHILDGLIQNNSQQDAMHYIQVLAASYAAGRSRDDAAATSR